MMSSFTITTTIAIPSGTTQGKRCHVLQPTRRAVQRQNTSLMLHVRSSSYCTIVIASKPLPNVLLMKPQTTSSYLSLSQTGRVSWKDPRPSVPGKAKMCLFIARSQFVKALSWMVIYSTFNIWQLFFADLLCRRKATLSRNSDGLAWAPTCLLVTLLSSVSFPLR